MKMYDCDVCLSAGSVNKWGFCEICGEEFEDPESRISWRNSTATWAVEGMAKVEQVFAPVGQDAA